MTAYFKNKNCRCVRCRTQGMMGPAVLITLGILFLLDNYHVAPFDTTFPVLFLVIGAVLLISRTGSTEGHIDPTWYASPGAQQTPPAQGWTAGGTTPPPSGSSDPEMKP
ncbi:MAG TPA: DUF5668 domain-containing protein [Candidatus Angelobacter sp.]|nr:DUF5668 domain-containing protein [Candidatus Angelobacter sp.]